MKNKSKKIKALPALVTEVRYQGFRSQLDKTKTRAERIADWLTSSFGTVWFLSANAVFFVVWISINMGIVPGIPAFDSYPYGMLTMVVSLEAIFLSVIVLMSQKRAGEVDDLREELDLEVNLWAEQEIKKILKMVDAIHDHLGLGEKDDEELTRMKQVTDIKKMTEELLKEMKEE